MIQQEEIESLLQKQCERYPELQIGDLLKALYQETHGCGHLIEDPSAAAAFIEQEARTSRETNGKGIEPLGKMFCRVHLSYLKESGLKAETLANLFALSAQAPVGGEEDLRKALNGLLAMAGEGRIPFPYEDVLNEVNQWQREAFPAKRHTEQFRAAYAPAYRVLRRDYAWALPVFSAVDKVREEKGRRIVAIEGGAAAGKSTLGDLLKHVYDCNLFHMDDFFLRPEQRTPQRYSQPGGNIDYERFHEEVLRPLTKGEPVQYRRFDCGTFQIQPPVELKPKALNIVEGSYSCHPQLANHYDFKVFLKVDPELQARRIRKRNDPIRQAQFFEKWLPLEQAYFDHFGVEKCCELVLEV